jgi:hypothetical protein
VPGLCHKCQLNKNNLSNNYISEAARNKIIAPTLKYCNQMQGSKFVQQYGWYVQQTYLQLGIYPQSVFNWGFAYLPNVCPAEYQQDIVAVKKGVKKIKEFTTKIENLTRQNLWGANSGFKYHYSC